MKAIARFLMRMGGWRYVGPAPDVEKAVLIVAPHTSISDFFWGKLALRSLGVRDYILMKKEFFVFPLNLILRALRVIPVDRSRNNHMVEQIAAKMQGRNRFFLVLTPEGTRKKTRRWKRGFLYIAKAAGVPVLLGKLDYKKKTAEVYEKYYPTDDPDADMRYIKSTYQGVTAKYPDQFTCEV